MNEEIENLIEQHLEGTLDEVIVDAELTEAEKSRSISKQNEPIN